MTKVSFIPASLFIFAAFAFADLGGSTAQAQMYPQYPFCAVYSLRTVSCGFNTMAQCLATVSGRGGYCEPNPVYQPPAKPTRRKSKRR